MKRVPRGTSALPGPAYATHGYAGRTAVMATMHGKERAVAPAFARLLDIAVKLPPTIDTDALGTFSGEVERPAGIVETAIAKARLGMRAAGCALGIASEGSFGPHPGNPFVAAGMEVMVFVDDASGLAIREHLLDDQPMYDHVLCRAPGEARALLQRIGFPRHAVIVQANEPGPGGAPIGKGIVDAEVLASAIARSAAASRDGRARVTTDMRAHMNPTRMRTLERLAERLAARIATPCPACTAPGYGQVGTEPGLPCAWCGEASTLVRHHVFGCVACDRSERRPRPDGLETADPGHCPFCNP